MYALTLCTCILFAINLYFFLLFSETSIVIIVAIALAIGVIILSFGLICLRWSVYTVFVIYRNYMISQNHAPFDF